MKILFAAPENAWGGFLGLLRAELPEHHFEATGHFSVDTLKGFEVLIPTMSLVSRELLETGTQLGDISQPAISMAVKRGEKLVIRNNFSLIDT